MKEKPPVLSDAEIEKIQADYIGSYEVMSYWRVKKAIKAQRDADVEWWGDSISVIQATQEVLNKKLDDVELAIQQAKAEVVGEIFEMLNNWLERHAPVTFPWNGYGLFVQELKDKYL